MATPKIIPYEVQLRSTKIKRNISRPVVYTNDLNSAEFQFKVIDMDAGDLSTATATTLLYMRDGSFFQNPKEDVSLVGTTFSYTLKENEGNHAGIAQIQLVVTIDDAEFALQLFDFEIINGLETKVAQEVMIYDWTTLTRDARDYIDQFVADEVFRDAQFENAQFDRNVAFVGSQESRALAFGVEQTDRGAAFTTEQTNRNTAFNNAQDARALTFSESESGRTTAENGRVTAEDDRVEAETDRVTEEGNRVTAESNRVTAESGRVTAESGRVTAESGRATTFAGYNARITGMETDVNADATNLVLNGDFSSGTNNWTAEASSEFTVTSGIAKVVNNGINIASRLVQFFPMVTNSKYYFRANGISCFGGVSSLELQIYDMTYGSKAKFVFGSLDINPSFVGHVMGDLSPLSRISINVNFSTVNTSSYFTVDSLSVINLTATFGAGNEPTAEQMDALLAKFPNSWFKGTANLFRANAALNKLLAVDARTEFDAKNAVVNGDFSNGTTGWASANSTSIAANNTLTNTADGSLDYAASAVTTPANANAIYYLRAKVKPLNSACLKLRVSNGNATILKEILSPVLNTEYTVSALGSSSTTTALINIRHYYADSATANGKAVEVKYVSVIDLTAAFGAGKEPTLAEMDRLMARFPNSWLDGVKSIQTIETLYQEKANKAQEAWVTPTLLNGWIAVSGYPVRYMKDNLGFVTIEGMISGGALAADAFLLPVGYRPNATLRFAVSSNLTSGTLLVNASGSVLPRAGSTTDFSITARFRAEA